MSEPAPKRLKKSKFPSAPLVAVVVVAAIAAALVGGYLGLCNWVKDNGLILPGTTVAGLPGSEPVDISKMDAESAKTLLSNSLTEGLEERALTITYGGQTARLEGSLLTADPGAPVESALSEKAGQPFHELGLLWLGLVGQGSEHGVSALTLSQQGKAQVESLAGQIADTLYVAPVDSTYEVTEKTVEVTRGTDGASVDKDALVQDITTALLQDQESLEVTAEVLPAKQVTGEALSQEVYREPQAPGVDSSGTRTPTVIGRSLDAAEAQSTIDATQPGETCSIPLTLTQPNFGNESGLYKDLLSSSDTHMAGTENRRTNIRLAAKAVNGTVLLPGEVFSYNQTVGQRTAEKGYKAATVYVGGEDKQELGGGICQLASALYYCSLYADLQIVSRANHRFAVTYVPYGLDATVAWPSLDYKFRNNTNYPIKIVAETHGTELSVKFYGTKENDHRVEMKTVQLSKTPFTTVYEVDSSLSAGKTKTLVHAYTGYKYESYRCVYDGSGKQISKEFEASSTYSFRNKVIGVSPADASKYGLSGGTAATPAPETTPPAQATLPIETTPEPTPTPAPTPTPEAPSAEPTPAPVEPSQEPAPVEPTAEPAPVDVPSEPSPAVETPPEVVPTPAPDPEVVPSEAAPVI